uniref:TPR_REGION domain-containing protein n=1 Tax=Angiostrongylus cantonensis TaxID=6313 RepID=A0A0K0DMA5_ANGCA
MSTASNGRARRSYIRDFISRIPIFRSTSTQGGTKEVDDGTHHHEPCYELAKKGEVLCRDCKFDDAIPILQEALALGSEELSILSPIYSQLGHSYHAVGDLPNAYKYHCYEDCLADGFYSLAAIYVRRAKQMVKKQLSIASEFDDVNAKYRAYINIGNAHHRRYKANSAIRYYQLALDLAVEESNRTRESKCCFCLANATYDIRDYHKAQEYSLRSMALAREQEDFTIMFHAYSMLARVCTKLDDYPKAAYFLACIRALAVQIHDEDMMTAAIESLIQLVEKHGQCLVSVDRNINFDGSNDSEPQSHVCRMKKVSGSISLTFTDQTSCEHVAFNETAQEERHALESVGAPPRKFEDDIIDLPLGVRSSRLDEQRCDIPVMLSRTITRRRQVDSGMVTLNEDPESPIGMVLDGEASRMMTQREVFLPGMKIKKATSALLHIPGYTLNEGVDPRIDEAIIDLLTNSREQGLNDQRSDVVITPKNSVGFGSIEEICVEEEASLVVIQLQAERLKASPLIEKL